MSLFDPILTNLKRLDPEALLEDHVRDASVELHDLMILSHSVEDSWASMVSTGIVEGLSG